MPANIKWRDDVTKLPTLIAALIAALSFAASTVAAEECARSATIPTPTIADIVTFRLVPGITPKAFLDHARATSVWLCTSPGFVRRNLTQNPDGIWVDNVEWADLTAAQNAANTAMQTPALMPFLQAIDPATMHMAHATFQLRLE